jgi:hypothetical protein
LVYKQQRYILEIKIQPNKKRVYNKKIKSRSQNMYKVKKVEKHIYRGFLTKKMLDVSVNIYFSIYLERNFLFHLTDIPASKP